SFFEHANNARACQSPMHLYAASGELARHQIAGVKLLIRELRVLVDAAAQSSQCILIRHNVGEQIHHEPASALCRTSSITVSMISKACWIWSAVIPPYVSARKPPPT